MVLNAAESDMLRVSSKTTICPQDMPTNDLGAPAFQKIDIEAWMPGLDRYNTRLQSLSAILSLHRCSVLAIEYSFTFADVENGSLLIGTCECHSWQSYGFAMANASAESHLRNVP